MVGEVPFGRERSEAPKLGGASGLVMRALGPVGFGSLGLQSVGPGVAISCGRAIGGNSCSSASVMAADCWIDVG